MMMGQWAGKVFALTLSQLAAKYDPQDDGTISSQLATALRIEAALTSILSNSLSTNPYPFIMLVNYASLPIENRSDKSGRTFLHWIVRLSDTTYHDPYWWDSRGANLIATKPQLDAASRASTNNPNIGIKERPDEMATGAFARAPYGRKYLIPWTGDARWPAYPSSTAAQQDALELRRRTSGYTIGNSHDDAGLAVITTDGTRGVEVVELWGWPQEARTTYNSFYAQYYPHAKVEYHGWSELNLDPPVLPATLKPGAILGVHELGYTGADVKSAQEGCPFIMVMDDATGVQNLQAQYPQFKFMHRYYFKDYVSAEWLVSDKHGIPPSGSNTKAWYRGFNEYDSPGFGGSVQDILRRAGEDRKCALMVKQRAPNAGWIAGGFPHGNPDFTKPEVCDAIRQGYAADYNAGLYAAFDMHNYTLLDPNNPFNWNYVAPMWIERNCDFLFQKCGFDPKVRRIIGTETGVEPRGFRGSGYNAQQFAQWATERYMPAMRAPLVVNGVSYPSPSMGGTLFQRGDFQGGSGWVGYEVSDYCGWLAQNVWPLTASAMVARDAEVPVSPTEGNRPPEGYVPEPKIYK